MRTKTFYIADDETVFTDELECEKYEAYLKHPAMYDIVFYDRYGIDYQLNETDPYDDYVYNSAETVILANEDQVQALQFLAKECGWFEFESLKDVGKWVRHEDDIRNPVWIKVDKGVIIDERSEQT